MDRGVENKPPDTDTTTINFLDFISDTAVPQRYLAKDPPLAPPDKPKNYLEKGIDSAVSLVITDPYLRSEVNHYGSSFTTTAALFARGKVGWVATPVMFGLANTSVDGSFSEKLQDFSLGAAKGTAMKGLYHYIGQSNQFAPTKGIMMGLASRGTDAVFQRDLFSDPSLALGRLQAEAGNKQALAYDALVWTVGEGVFAGTNSATSGAITRNKYLSGMFMGGTFGAINGGSQEIMRQQNLGATTIDWEKVAKRGLLQAGVDAGAAGFGIGISDPKLHRAVSELLQNKSVQIASVATLSLALAQTPERALASETPTRDRGDNRPVPAGKENPGGEPGDKHGEQGAGKEPLKDATAKLKLVGPDGKELKLTTAGINLSIFKNPAILEGPQIRDHGNTTISVMAPLMIGDPANPEGPASSSAWAEFDRQLTEAKKIGVHAVSTDVWWGLIEPKEGQFSWNYYDKMADHISRAGLKWTPILSFHQCGVNVGDNVHVPVPDWVWSKLAAKMGTGDARAAQYVSEQGNASTEYVSAWATDLILDNYGSVMRQFQGRYANRSGNIAEINISLGPAGELRFPSYNAHDQGTGYPTRGALQAYSDLAKASFRAYSLERYGGIEGLRTAWHIPDLTPERINPPDNPNDFFNQQDHLKLQYGRDFFDWYNDSLLSHGRKVLGTAVSVFGDRNAPFLGIDIGAKIPGVHWYLGERQGENLVLNGRLAELAAGLIRTSGNDWTSDEAGRGYRPVLALFKEFQPLHAGKGSHVVPAMTALELADGQDGQHAQSMPNTLAHWVGDEAQRQQLKIHGENALSFTLADPGAWQRIREFLKMPSQPGAAYSGMTLLRLGDVVNNPLARAQVSEIVNAINTSKPRPTLVPVAPKPVAPRPAAPGSPNAA